RSRGSNSTWPRGPRYPSRDGGAARRRTGAPTQVRGGDPMHIHMRRRGRALFLVSVVIGLGILTAAPAFAQDDSGSPQVVITGRAIVAPNETNSSIVIADGPVLIAGTVTGSVVAFHGPVTISGTVDGSVYS